MNCSSSSLLFRLQLSSLSAQQALILQTSIDSWLWERQAGFSQNRIIILFMHVFCLTLDILWIWFHIFPSMFPPCDSPRHSWTRATTERSGLKVKQLSGSASETFFPEKTTKSSNEELGLLQVRLRKSSSCGLWLFLDFLLVGLLVVSV